MAKRYLFADEAGDFAFKRGDNISKYFIVCTVTMNACDCAHDLLALRRELVWEREKIGDYFHATTDTQAVRDRVFDVLAKHDFQVQATIMEKAKAQEHVRSSEPRFYQYGWFYHFKHALAPYIAHDDQLQVTAASIGTKKGQAVFTSSVNDVVQQHLPRSRWATFFCQSMSDPCLQIADYCTWAIQRKWERGDERSYDLIKHRVTHEYELWRTGRTLYY